MSQLTRFANHLFLVVLLAVVAGCQPAAERISPPQTVPATDRWYFGRTVYEINVREFSASGDLAGATSRLDHLLDLGVRHLVLMPLHPGGQAGHLYAPADHDALDQAYGRPEDLRSFLAEAHRRGMHVSLDMVLNHAAVDHVRAREHPQWWTRDAEGHLTREIRSWTFAADFDFASQGVRRYLTEAVLAWARDYDLDGLRFSHASLVPLDFWQEMVPQLRRQTPGLFLMAESPRSIMFDAGFDAIYSPQAKAAMDFAALDDMAQPGLNDDIWKAFSTVLEAGPGRSLTVHFLEDHYGRRSARDYRWPYLRGFAAVLLTGPGIPQLHCGQEIHWARPTDLSGRRPVDWAQGQPEVLAMYRDLLHLREASPALRKGDYVRIPTESTDILVYTRTWKAETTLVAANLSDYRPTFTLPDSLARLSWHPWQRGSFAKESQPLPGELELHPCEYRVWTTNPDASDPQVSDPGYRGQ